MNLSSANDVAELAELAELNASIFVSPNERLESCILNSARMLIDASPAHKAIRLAIKCMCT